MYLIIHFDGGGRSWHILNFTTNKYPRLESIKLQSGYETHAHSSILNWLETNGRRFIPELNYISLL